MKSPRTVTSADQTRVDQRAREGRSPVPAPLARCPSFIPAGAAFASVLGKVKPQ